MRPATVFLIASLLALVFGLGFVVAPSAVLSIYGTSTDPPTLLLGRFFGVALIQLGLTLYLLREVREPATIRALGIGGTVGSFCGALVSLTGTMNGVTNSMGWSSVAIYAFLTFGYATCLRVRVA